MSGFKGVAFLIVAVCVSFCSAAHAQIAPGPLSKAHADLKGLLNCSSCHGLLGRGLKCLECHDEIKRRVEAGAGYHARANKRSDGNCASCHDEHRGPDFDFIPLERESFNHGAMTGFELEGKHSEQQCENCHNVKNMDTGSRLEIKMKDLNRSFLGLGRECVSCHRDPHEQQLGTDCLQCHDLKAWRPASGFSHSGTAFPLTGRHNQVVCGSCHPGAAADGAGNEPVRNIPVKDGSDKKLLFKGVPFGGCESCHADPHGGAFLDLNIQGGCRACHATAGWTRNRPGNNFDHDLTKFRLIGKHADLSCDTCHSKSDFRAPIAHDLCGDCHEDPHKGRFGSQIEGSDCSACHRPTGFNPSLFTRESHSQSVFPLEGKHANLTCSGCHKTDEQKVLQATDQRSCSECHADRHDGEFVSDSYNNQCDLCHTTEGFETTSFTRARHMQTQFPLTGEHAGLACGKCHRTYQKQSAGFSKLTGTLSKGAASDTLNSEADLRPRFRFGLGPGDCDACHKDPHEMRPEAGLPCKTCHVSQRLDAPLPFDHSRAGIRLEGPHQYVAQTVACTLCHEPVIPVERVTKRKVPIFSVINLQCSRCHGEKDPHGGQFMSPESHGKDCVSCHVMKDWKTPAFDHNEISFNLNGAHRTLSCVACHRERKEMNGNTVRIYRGTPSECLECH